MTSVPLSRPTGGLAPRPPARWAALCALVALVGWAPGASASPVIRVDPASGSPGSVVTVHGSGFCGTAGCGAVEVLYSGQLAATGVRVAPDGTFRGTFRVPGGGVPGPQHITATQRLADGNELRAFASYDLVLSKGEEAERQAEANDLQGKSPDALVSEGQAHGVPLASYAASVAPSSGAPAAGAGDPVAYQKSPSRLPQAVAALVVLAGLLAAVVWWLRRPIVRAAG